MTNPNRNLGSAHSGTEHFWQQRLTAVFLIPLTFWLAVGLAQLPDMSLESFKAWVASPVTFIALVAYVFVGLHHGNLGLQMIIEDYVTSHRLRLAIWVGVLFFSLILGLIALFALLHITLG